jgi:glucokinase
MGAPVAVIGAGTGLGEASLIWVEGKAVVIPGEGGHTDLAPGNSQEAGFLQWLWKQGKSGCWEDALSGPGLVAIHRYLCESQGEESGGEALFAAEVAERDPEAMRIFWSLYGAEAGNMALRVLARGGVYLAGGIAAKNLDRLDREAFLRRFENKGALSRVLEAIPVYVVTEPSLGLLGAAAAMQPLE